MKNKPRGRPAVAESERKQRILVSLSRAAIARAEQLGDGDRSRGIETALAALRRVLCLRGKNAGRR